MKNTVSSQFLGNVAEKTQKTFFFSTFLRTLYKVSWKTWKNTHTFCITSRKKTLFLRTLTKCPKRREKNTFFSHFLRNVAQKKPKKRCFFAFLANYAQSVSKNEKIHCFLKLFVERRAKTSKNAVFCIFCELCTKCLEKREKKLFSHTFCGTLRKKNAFFANFDKVSEKTWKNTVFSHFLRNVSQKKTLFLWTLTKCPKRREKTLFSHTFCGTSQEKMNKTLFSHIFRGTTQKKLKNAVFRIFCVLCTKCLKRREKTLFTHIFWGTSQKKLKICWFFSFSANFVQSVLKNVKEHCFVILFA